MLTLTFGELFWARRTPRNILKNPYHGCLWILRKEQDTHWEHSDGNSRPSGWNERSISKEEFIELPGMSRYQPTSSAKAGLSLEKERPAEHAHAGSDTLLGGCSWANTLMVWFRLLGCRWLCKRSRPKQLVIFKRCSRALFPALHVGMPLCSTSLKSASGLKRWHADRRGCAQFYMPEPLSHGLHWIASSVTQLFPSALGGHRETHLWSEGFCSLR